MTRMYPFPDQSQPKFCFDVSPVIKNIPALSRSLDLAVPKFFYTLPSFHDAQMNREFALMKKVISDSLSTGRKKEEGKNYVPILRFDKDIRWIFEEFNTVIFRLNYNHNYSSSSSRSYLLFAYQRSFWKLYDTLDLRKIIHHNRRITRFNFNLYII